MTSSAPAGSAWRTFAFFNAQAVHDRLEPGQSPPAFKNAAEVSTVCSGQGFVIVADIHGSVHVCNIDLETVRTFVAHPDNGRVTHAKFAAGKGILVTLGEEEASPHPVLKIWNLKQDDKRTGSPRLLASGRVAYGSRSHPVSTFAITPTLSLIAVGMADGTVLMLRQLDQYLRAVTATSGPATIPKPKLVHATPGQPVTGLGFKLETGETDVKNTITSSVSTARDHGTQRNGGAADTQPDANAAAVRSVALYIVTTHQILLHRCTPTGKPLSSGSSTNTSSSSSSHANVLDEIGAALNCAALLPDGSICLAKDEAIFVYTPEGRAQSYFYQGPKSAISTYLGHIVITSPPFTPTASSQSATVRNFVREQRSANLASAAGVNSSGPGSEPSSDIAKVTVFDPENRFVSFTSAFPEGVREVFCEWGDIFVYTNDSRLSRLVERSTSDKLNMLYAKNLYPQAVSLARQAGWTEQDVAQIFKKHADHLYRQGHFDQAMEQYIKTIGSVQPSHVIRKYLDGQRIINLTSYLQAVHEKKLANSDITTLLLNCYAKLKDTERLDAFITNAAVAADQEVPFDLDTAIRVCRQAGYFDHAVYLAKTFDRPEDYLRIQVEDCQDYPDALEYIRTLDQDRAQENLQTYGSALLNNLPSDTTNLLIDLCCGTLARPAKAKIADTPSASKATGRTSYLSYLALSKARGRNNEQTTSSTQGPDQARNGARVERPSQDERKREDVSSASTEVQTTQKQEGTNGVALPDPLQPLPQVRQFFSLFLDHPQQFIRFLETIVERRWRGKTVPFLDNDATATNSDRLNDDDETEEAEEIKDAKAYESVMNTLIELYLTEASSAQTPATEKAKLENKAMDILTASADERPLDVMQALLDCSTANFVPGILAIYEQLEQYEEIVRYWIDRAESEQSNTQEADRAVERVIEALDKYGPEGHHELYPLVLRFLTSASGVLSKHQSDLVRILDFIHDQKIMAPIAVVQVLSKGGVATVGAVKDYLQKQIAGEQEESEADRKLAESYRQDIAKKEKEIEELSDPNSPRVFQVTRCSACGGMLDLPAVHFMCKHSFHQRCLADNEVSCPLCAASHGVVQEIKTANDQLVGRHDLFVQELESSDDRFDTIVSAFAKGLVRPNEAS